MQKAEIIRAIFAAYLSNDRKAVEEALTDDFRFTSPYDDEIDKTTISRAAGAIPTGSSGISLKESSPKAMRPS
jgi:ketosteroid isomerase-like protein